MKSERRRGPELLAPGVTQKQLSSAHTTTKEAQLSGASGVSPRHRRKTASSLVSPRSCGSHSERPLRRRRNQQQCTQHPPAECRIIALPVNQSFRYQKSRDTNDAPTLSVRPAQFENLSALFRNARRQWHHVQTDGSSLAPVSISVVRQSRKRMSIYSWPEDRPISVKLFGQVLPVASSWTRPLPGLPASPGEHRNARQRRAVQSHMLRGRNARMDGSGLRFASNSSR